MPTRDLAVLLERLADQMVKDAVAKEREACAKIADVWNDQRAGVVIAEQIRARQ